MTIRILGIGLMAATLLASAPAGAAQSFEAAVGKVLRGQKEGRVAELSEAKKSELIACVVTAIAAAPEAKKRRLAEGANFSEMEDRFGEIVMADRAKLKQKITLDCGEIATSE